MSGVQAVIFDLDDTLVGTKALAVYREHGQKKELRENIQKSKLYKPVPDMLSEIKKRGIPLALVTNSPRWYTDELLAYHQIDKFDVIVSYDDVKQTGCKPSPLGINLALKELGLTNKHNCIYVGDQASDIVAAYEAGIKPVAPSWATRNPIDQVPATIVSSTDLIQCLDNFDDLALIADRTALNRTFDFPKKHLSFLPLNDSGNVVSLNKEDIKLIALGRYFSKNGKLTSIKHEQHQLSKDISQKDQSDTYVVPEYYVDLLTRVSETLPLYIFEQEASKFDIVTVIPSKKEKNPRLENMLKRIGQKSKSGSKFIKDIFEFRPNSNSLKTLGGKAAREAELNKNFVINSRRTDKIRGKSILVIDDVLTTGSTFQRAFALLEQYGAGFSFGVCLAKTVSVKDEMKTCPDCNRRLQLNTNSRTGIRFYGCTGFHEKLDQCKYSENIRVKDCPRCSKGVYQRYNPHKKTIFLSCESYGTESQCGFAENIGQE